MRVRQSAFPTGNPAGGQICNTPTLHYSNGLELPPILDKKSQQRQIDPGLESQKILSRQLRHGGQGSSSGKEVASEMDQGE